MGTNVSKNKVHTGVVGVLALVVLGGLLNSGCTNVRTSEPKRTATEQLLISTAADRALEEAAVVMLQGRKVYLDTTYFESLDEDYVIGSIRDLFISNGVLLYDSLEEAEIVVEVRSGALSIDTYDSLAGLPSMPMPVPFTGTIKTPEMALYKAYYQKSIAKFALVAYEKESRKHLYSSRPLVGKAHDDRYHILGFFKWHSTNIPEKRRNWPGREED